jgi:hypothetical protein
MNSINNRIAIRNQSIILEKDTHQAKPKVVLALVADIAQLGFRLDQKALNIVKTFSNTKIKELHKVLFSELSTLLDVDANWIPLFKNFPEDVPEEPFYYLSRLSVFFGRWFAFEQEDESTTRLSCGCIIDSALFDVDLFGACPVCQMQTNLPNYKITRKPLRERVKLKVIELTTKEGVEQYLQNLLNAKSSLSVKSKEDLTLYFSEVKDGVSLLLPKEVPIKENMAFISALLVKHTNLAALFVPAYVKTATDVLRLAVALSGGDVSLKEKSNFKLKNGERSILFKLFEQVKNPQEDMLRYRSKWLRLGEYLHVGAKRLKYPNVYKAFDTLRNHEEKIETFSRQSHKALLSMKKSHVAKKSMVSLLKQRPGEFARKLDMILRESKDAKVIKEFSTVIGSVATPLLLKLTKHLATRNKASNFRFFIPKGNMAKIYFMEKDTRKKISQALITKTASVINEELLKRFAKEKKIKRVYIDPKLKDYIIPLAQRNASKALLTVERGSKSSYDEKAQALRMFVYWHESEKTGRIDVDLSAVGFDEDWNYVTHLSYTSLQKLGGVHSGDIQSAPNGAAEFIDINVAKFRKASIRYVIMSVFSFTQQTYNNFECFAGVMERQSPNSGEIFEAKTVKNKFDLAGETNINLPLILDLETNQMIWCDVSLDSNFGPNNIERAKKRVSYMGRSILSMGESLPNLFELFSLHAQAQGAKVDTVLKESVKYDLVIDESKSKDFADILANWL